MYTTLNRIREHEPCKGGWETLLKYLGKTKPDDEPLPLLTILESNGLEHTLWCLRAVEGFEKEKLLLGIGYAREVEHLMPAESKKALDVYDRYANGLATQEEFENARRCGAAAWAAGAAAGAGAGAAVWAAGAAVWAGAGAAVWAGAGAAAAAWAAGAGAAADAAAWAAADAASSTIRTKQENQLRQLLEETK